jgi:hypothetical protein
VFMTIARFRTARRQERYWQDVIERRYEHQTVRTVCRLPRIRRFAEARLNRFSFDDYVQRLSPDQVQTLPLTVATIKVLLFRTLAPRRVTGLAGLLQCQCCGRIGALPKDIRHSNGLWSRLVWPESYGEHPCHKFK